jgi:hypothetical protein
VRFWRIAVSIERPEPTPTNDDTRTIREDARVAYKTAVDLWITSTNQTWARFNVMLVVNGILLALPGQFAVENKLALPLLWYLLFPFAGIALCYLWGAVLSRGLKYEDCYRNVARELEKTHLSPTVSVVSRGAQVGACMKGIGRLPARVAARRVVLLFVLLHIAAACWIIYRVMRPSIFGSD